MPPTNLQKPDRPRRGLLVAVLCTLAVVLASVAGLPGPAQVQRWVGAALGPLQRVLAPASEESDTATQVLRVQEQLRVATNAVTDGAEFEQLLASPATSGATLVPAHVIGVGAAGASGPARITIDAGSRDGITPDTTVVDRQGLVGRVVSVTPWTSDVALLGSPEVVVGVRVGSAGHLGTVGATAVPGGSVPPPGQLRLQMVQQGDVSLGDEVVSLGSIDGRPFVAGIPVGTVTAVDPLEGRATRTATVRLHTVVSELRLVAVLAAVSRQSPRPAVAGADGGLP